MLIEPEFKLNDIITLRLVAGEEIVAKYMGHDADAFLVNKPNALVTTQQGLGLAPYIMTADPGTMRIHKTTVVLTVKTNTDAAGNYIKATTGIVPASAGVPANNVPKIQL